MRKRQEHRINLFDGGRRSPHAHRLPDRLTMSKMANSVRCHRSPPERSRRTSTSRQRCTGRIFPVTTRSSKRTSSWTHIFVWTLRSLGVAPYTCVRKSTEVRNAERKADEQGTDHGPQGGP